MSYKQQAVADLFKLYASKLMIALVAIAIAVFAWANLFFHLNIEAKAETISRLPIAVTAEGINDQIEGKVEKNLGKAERGVGKITGQSEGALKQAKGKAKEEIGQAKNKLEEVGDQAENTSESFIDSVKDFFN